MKDSISLFNNIRQKLLPADIIDVLRHRDFKLLFAATFAANLGDAFYFVALPWLVLAYGGSATAVGLTGAAAMLPYVLLGPLAGVISDRVNRKKLMIGSDLARAFIIAVLVAAGWLGLLQTWHFAIAAFLLTAAGLFMFPARGALIPSLVPKGGIGRGKCGVMLTGFQMMNIAGKAAGGFLIIANRTDCGAMGLCGATYIVSFILISRMAAPSGARRTRDGANARIPGSGNRPRFGLDSARFIARHPLIRAVALTVGLALNALHFPAMTMLLPLHLVRLAPSRTGGVWTLLWLSSRPACSSRLRFRPGCRVGLATGVLGALDNISTGCIGSLICDRNKHVWQALALALLMGIVSAGGPYRWEVLFRQRRRTPIEVGCWRTWRLLVLRSSLSRWRSAATWSTFTARDLSTPRPASWWRSVGSHYWRPGGYARRELPFATSRRADLYRS